MQPLIVAEQIRQGAADFLAEPGNVVKGHYISIQLPFRNHADTQKAFAWLDAGFNPYTHQGINDRIKNIEINDE